MERDPFVKREEHHDEDSDLPENLTEHLLIGLPIGQDRVHLKL